MFATIAIQIPLVVLPVLQVPPPTRDCLLEVLSRQAIEERAFAGFDTAVQRYVVLHRHLARSLAMPHDDDDLFHSEGLRAAIIAARPQAGAGQFFTSEVTILLRERIDAAFAAHPGAATSAIVRGGYEPLPGEPGPQVNEPFPPVVASVRWMPLGRALPPLPRELDFALWGRDLVLVDVAANLVLDILPEALPESAGPGVLYP
jgi:hypothetical protein